MKLKDTTTKSHESRHLLVKSSPTALPYPLKKKEKLLRKNNCTSNHHHSRFLRQFLAQEKRKRGKLPEKFGINIQIKIFFKGMLRLILGIDINTHSGRK